MICQSQTYSSVSCKQIHFHWSGQPKVFNIKLIWEKSEKMCIFLMKICLYILRFVFYKLFSTKCPINHFYRKHVWVTRMEAQTWRGHINVICLKKSKLYMTPLKVSMTPLKGKKLTSYDPPTKGKKEILYDPSQRQKGDFIWPLLKAKRWWLQTELHLWPGGVLQCVENQQPCIGQKKY